MTFRHERCPYRQQYIRRLSRNDCSVQESPAGIPAGAAQNVTAHCKYNSTARAFYYEITWEPPARETTNVILIRVLIHNFYTGQRFCFQLPAHQTQFRFHRELGFIERCSFRYGVTPQPVVRDRNGSFRQELMNMPACPLGPVILDLFPVRFDRASCK